MQVTNETVQGRNQRPSLIDFLTGGELGGRHGSKSHSDTPQQSQAKGTPCGLATWAISQLDAIIVESSSSASYVSTPIQLNATINEAVEGGGLNGVSTPSHVPTGKSIKFLLWC